MSLHAMQAILWKRRQNSKVLDKTDLVGEQLHFPVIFQKTVSSLFQQDHLWKVLEG